MNKAKPGHRARNKVRRSKGYTIQEWRAIFEPVFKKVKHDIYKNMKAQVTIWDIPDVEQELEESFVKFYNRFMAEDDKYEFPPTGGAFYINNIYTISRRFLYTGVIDKNIQVYSSNHDIVMRRKESDSMDFYEDREQRMLAEEDCHLCDYLEQHLGVSIDDVLGPEFALWWMGYEYAWIALNLSLFGPRVSYTTVQRRVSMALGVMGEKYDMTKDELKEARRGCLNYNKLTGNTGDV